MVLMGAENRAQFYENLYRWYGEHGRMQLPWRNTRDPYAILLSEVMLQQTQVATVLGRFYYPFLEQFPTVESLANATESQVMKMWQGLGYYSRARNLHKAAKQLVAEYGGTGEVAWPRDVQAWQELPGVGKNTANAVCSFAFGVAVPVMEANLKRVISRIYGQLDGHSAAGIKQLWQRAGELLDADNSFDYNQAMMDLGATICVPRAPNCDACPAEGICQGKDSPEDYPKKRKRKQIPVRNKQIVLFANKNRYYILRRTGNFLSGLYGFAEYDANEPVIWQEKQVMQAALKPLGSISQTYSHFRLEADIFVCEVSDDYVNGDFRTPQEILALPLSKAEEKV